MNPWITSKWLWRIEDDIIKGILWQLDAGIYKGWRWTESTDSLKINRVSS